MRLLPGRKGAPARCVAFSSEARQVARAVRWRKRSDGVRDGRHLGCRRARSPSRVGGSGDPQGEEVVGRFSGRPRKRLAKTTRRGGSGSRRPSPGKATRGARDREVGVKSSRASDCSRRGRASQKGFSALTFRTLAGPTSVPWFTRRRVGAHSLRAAGNRRTRVFTGAGTFRGRSEARETRRLCSWIVSIAEAFGQRSVPGVSR